MNRVILSGNLTRDPDVRYTQNGKAVAKMGIAVARPFNREQADFFNLVVWDKQAEFCQRYLKKGSSVIIEGRIQNDNYEDKNGVKRYNVDVIVDRIEFAGSGGGGRKQDNGGESYGGGGSRYDDNDPPFNDDADVPF